VRQQLRLTRRDLGPPRAMREGRPPEVTGAARFRPGTQIGVAVASRQQVRVPAARDRGGLHGPPTSGRSAGGGRSTEMGETLARGWEPGQLGGGRGGVQEGTGTNRPRRGQRGTGSRHRS